MERTLELEFSVEREKRYIKQNPERALELAIGDRLCAKRNRILRGSTPRRANWSSPPAEGCRIAESDWRKEMRDQDFCVYGS